MTQHINQLTPEDAVWARDATRRVMAQVENIIVGKHEVVELLMVALLARGHVLIEDIPGVGKTMVAKALAKALGATFKRIQFTPDLLPGDLTGLNVYNQRTTEFQFSPGPLFTNVLLADEINRATPKTQSALLESMEEAQVTIDGVTRPLPQPFFVLATQNPIEYRGTYPLPEAQMDRFIMRLRIGYPGKDEEVEMLARHSDAGSTASGLASANAGAALLTRVEPALSGEEVARLEGARQQVHVAPAVREYIVAIVRGTRQNTRVLLGASPRGALALQRAAQGAAILTGREFVTPDDVKRLAPIVLAHRLILQGDSGAGITATAAESILQQLLDEVPVP